MAIKREVIMKVRQELQFADPEIELCVHAHRWCTHCAATNLQEHHISKFKKIVVHDEVESLDELFNGCCC